MPNNQIAARTSELVSSFRLHETGLEAVGTPTMEDWLAAGEFINKSERAVHFWIGDWLNYGEKAWGERYQEALEQTRYDYGTLRNDKWVASRIPLARRKPELSFSHHVEVADLEPDEQDDLLQQAVAEQLNREKFRKLVTEHTKPLQDRSLSRQPDKQTPAGAFIERMVEFRIELTGLDLTNYAPEERATLNDQANRLAEQLLVTLDELKTYEDPADTNT